MLGNKGMRKHGKLKKNMLFSDFNMKNPINDIHCERNLPFCLENGIQKFLFACPKCGADRSAVKIQTRETFFHTSV